MLQLLIELLAQPRQLVRIAQLFGVDLLVVQARVGTIDRLVVGVRPFAPRLRTAGPVVAFCDRGILVRIRCLRRRPRRLPSPPGWRRACCPARTRSARSRPAARPAGRTARRLPRLPRSGPRVRRRSPPRPDRARPAACARRAHNAFWSSCARFISTSAASAVSPSVSRHRSRMRCAAGGDCLARTSARAPAGTAPPGSATGPCASCGRSLRPRTPRASFACRLAATPAMWREPTTSTRTCSSASYTSLASRRAGMRAACTASS